MIINNSERNKNFLKKDLLPEDISQEDLDKVWRNISEYMNSNIESVNELNDTFLNALDTTASNSNFVINKISGLSSLLADLYAISGSSQTSLNIYKENIKNKPSGITINKDLLTIGLDNDVSNIYVPKNIRINTDNGSLGNSKEFDSVQYSEIDNIISSHSRLEIESFGSELIASIEVDLGQILAINNISFGIINFGIRLPRIDSIETSTDGLLFTKNKIKVSNSEGLDIDDFRFKSGNVVLDIEESKSRFIRINFIQNYSYQIEGTLDNRFPIGIKGLKLALLSSIDSGDIVIGPMFSDSEIFKVSLDGELTNVDLEDKNISFEVSHNNDAWFPLDISSVFISNSDNPKVVNFNTIDRDSISTNDPVFKLYLRIKMSSTESNRISNNDNIIERYRSVIDSVNVYIDITERFDDINVYKLLGQKFGARNSNPPGQSITNRTSISDFSDSGKKMVRSVGSSNIENYININDTLIQPSQTQSITVSNKYDLCLLRRSESILCEPTFGFDPYAIIIHKFSKPIRELIDFESSDRKLKLNNQIPVLSTSISSGKYYLYIGQDIIEVDLSSGFLYSNSELIYVIQDKSVTSIKIYDEIGNLFGTVSTTTYGEAEESIIHLGEVFGVPYPFINGLSYEHMYPLKELSPDSYSIAFGEVIFGSYSKGQILMDRVIKEVVPHTVVNGINNSKKILLSKSKEVKKTYSLLGNDFKQTIKLKDTNVINGTVTFDYSKSSINSFINEVNFINGKDEFVVSNSFLDIDNFNKEIIVLDSSFIDNESIVFSNQSNLFINRVYSVDELVEEGDWMIDKSISPRILLPEGIRTSGIIDLEIKYDIENSKFLLSGVYSIDYKRGILHSAAPIDHKAIISYRYSYIFAEYEAMELIDRDKFEVNGQRVLIKNSEDSSIEYVAITSADGGTDNNFKVSPSVSELKINTITKADFL